MQNELIYSIIVLFYYYITHTYALIYYIIYIIHTYIESILLKLFPEC